MNVVLVSHSNFLAQSAMHVFSIAQELTRRRHDVLVVVPVGPETVKSHGEPLFRLALYADALATAPSFSNGRGADFVHAWSPREHVRKATQSLAELLRCPYLVHMEDNEEQIGADLLRGLELDELARLPGDLLDDLSDFSHRSHLLRYRHFIAGAAGYTCLIDPLLEFAPAEMPKLRFWPGFDVEFATGLKDREARRTEHGVETDETLLLYSGNAHPSNADDIRRLYTAVALLRRRGRKVRLIRTGRDDVDLGFDAEAKREVGLVSLGFVPRAAIPVLVGISDILVQPGRSDAFNDYRFPSKLPEYLVSGRPVVLPDSNIGKVLTDGVHVLKLDTGDAFDIARKVERLMNDAALRERLGAAGRRFALEHLTWHGAVDQLERFYRNVLGERSTPCSARRATRAERVGAPPRPEYPVSLVAFYLPQFHPIPENDAWWGRGFTEWTNVVRAPQNFRYHDQPRLPTELGFYDLRVPEVLDAQVVLARAHGISGFCFYYYWFDGRRLLEKPLDVWLSRQGPDFPFCICWANEPWSRRWDGSDTDVLQPQPYGTGFAERFILDVLPILKDPRYLHVDGAPLLAVYRIGELPDPIGAVQTWRKLARANGVPKLHLVAVQSFGLGDPRPYGLDAAIEFLPPHVDRRFLERQRIYGLHPRCEGFFEDYLSMALRSIHVPPADYVRYRGLFPRWDNTARRQRFGHVFVNDSPKAYAQWLRYLVHEALVRRGQQMPLVFINAWNEWSEGTYLEPDETYGRALLEVTRAALHEGVIDFVRGRSPGRELAFTASVSRLPSERIGQRA